MISQALGRQKLCLNGKLDGEMALGSLCKIDDGKTNNLFGLGINTEHHIIFCFHAPHAGRRLPSREVENVGLFIVGVVEFQRMMG